MAWNPEVYNQFKDIRFKPFFDLSALLQETKDGKAIDLGCGTGEQTAMLAEKFPKTQFLGIDNSSEMLAQSKSLEKDNLHFQLSSTEEMIAKEEKWDLIFSNAALQWSDNHLELFPKLIAKLNKAGQFAVQMPYQNENTLNQLLYNLANQEPYKSQLQGWNRPSQVLHMDTYTQLLFENGLKNLQISQRVYPLIADNHESLFQFISGSALIPYLARLNDKEKEDFKQAFKLHIAESFAKLPAIYAFKRILLYGIKE